MKFIDIYLCAINLLSFILYWIDKVLAIKKKWRISERTLFLMGFLGGPVGSLLGMRVFHHKTKKISFYIGNILFLVAWVYFYIKVYVL